MGAFINSRCIPNILVSVAAHSPEHGSKRGLHRKQSATLSTEFTRAKRPIPIQCSWSCANILVIGDKPGVGANDDSMDERA